jgi:hypothetical protein
MAAPIDTTEMNTLCGHAQTGVSVGFIEELTMRTGRSISIDSAVWTEIGKVSDNETEGDVSAAVEKLCREAVKERGIEI